MTTTTFIEGNNVNTTLAAAATSSATTLTLASSANLPTLSGGAQMALTLNDAATGAIYEIVYVTAITGATLTVLRAQENTTAQNWNIGDFAFCAPTAGTVAQINGNPANQFQVAAATGASQAINASQAQDNSVSYAADTGTANTYAVTLTPAPTLTRGATFGTTIAHANTGASTLALNGGTAYPIWGGAYSPLQGGELAVNGYAEFEYNPTLNSGNPVYVLLENTGGALQVSPATQSGHAVQQVQVVGLAGDARNLVASLATAGKSVTFTFDEAFVKTALGGPGYVVTGTGGLTINTAGTGAGGMDTGTPVVSGYVAVYLIVNTTTGAKALLAQNEPSGGAPTIYGGANMPSGYTSSGLISVLATDSSGNFKIFTQNNRAVSMAGGAFITQSSASAVSVTSASLATYVPKTAKFVSGFMSISNSTASTNVSLTLISSTVSSGSQSLAATSSVASSGTASPFSRLMISVLQTVYWVGGLSGGTASWSASATQYEI